MTQEDKEVIVQYLSQVTFKYKGIERYSTLNAGLRECRLMTMRNESGDYDTKKEFGYPGHWLGAVGYFTVLDQIGTFFKPKGESSTGANNKIAAAISRFGYDLIDKEDRKLGALIALRNCFTHDFNLLNIPVNPNKIALEQHKFEVYAKTDQTDTIVTLSSVVWDGNIPEKDFYRTDDTTKVNLFAFGSMVEKIVKRIGEKINSDELELENDIQYLINKYTFVTSEHTVKNSPQ